MQRLQPRQHLLEVYRSRIALRQCLKVSLSILARLQVWCAEAGRHLPSHRRPAPICRWLLHLLLRRSSCLVWHPRCRALSWLLTSQLRPLSRVVSLRSTCSRLPTSGAAGAARRPFPRLASKALLLCTVAYLSSAAVASRADRPEAAPKWWRLPLLPMLTGGHLLSSGHRPHLSVRRCLPSRPTSRRMVNIHRAGSQGALVCPSTGGRGTTALLSVRLATLAALPGTRPLRCQVPSLLHRCRHRHRYRRRRQRLRQSRRRSSALLLCRLLALSLARRLRPRARRWCPTCARWG